jgi:hypothetical protein
MYLNEADLRDLDAAMFDIYPERVIDDDFNFCYLCCTHEELIDYGVNDADVRLFKQVNAIETQFDIVDDERESEWLAARMIVNRYRLAKRLGRMITQLEAEQADRAYVSPARNTYPGRFLPCPF